MTGNFIVFEGGEGSGKSTQAARVAAELDAVLTRQPGGTDLGVAVRQLLLTPSNTAISSRSEALLMAADRAQHVEELIRPALAAGRNVVCDRYVGSSLAYQGAARGLGIDQVLGLSEFAVDGLWPSLTILLDVDPEVGLGRIDGAPDRLEQEASSFHQNVRRGYLEAAERYSWVIIDASLPIDEVSAKVDVAVAQCIGRGSSQSNGQGDD